MSLLLLHASTMSMDGRQMLISMCCRCNNIPWVHFTEFGKYNFCHLGTTAETMSMLHFSGTEVQACLLYTFLLRCFVPMYATSSFKLSHFQFNALWLAAQ